MLPRAASYIRRERRVTSYRLHLPRGGKLEVMAFDERPRGHAMLILQIRHTNDGGARASEVMGHESERGFSSFMKSKTNLHEKEEV